MATSIRPFLMFEGKAEEAMAFYAGLFPGSSVSEIRRFGPNDPGPEGSILVATFTLAGQSIMCSDSFVPHAFSFTPSLSLFVDCESVDQIDSLAGALAEGGAVLMPLDDYGFSRRFAWVTDRYGVSWQLNLA
ncbi:VOC family protein [Aquabacter spiritensis]|uniref:Putative 3-demethylubiquinone-9 3-methyltransferase (Glyoxalase superfamily) n=1 Tax=Aquabacter spiritensis TaxID=933073 RepID=A0A4R3LY35_9HYPH|nr:VOC family protein [Aquabacter spiritensis]TCT05570.1 putative 3-demethylubiquinone-9 3-methyltransferase (glyoxalase superfamily) [Aquabacter spiritensis]